jgi:hypothetical protein
MWTAPSLNQPQGVSAGFYRQSEPTGANALRLTQPAKVFIFHQTWRCPAMLLRKNARLRGRFDVRT